MTSPDATTDICYALSWLNTFLTPEATDKEFLSLIAACADSELAMVPDVLQFWSWHAVLAKPAAVMWRAASPATPPTERGALVTVLRAFANAGLFDGGWRIICARQGEDVHDGLQFSAGEFTLPDGWLLMSEQAIDTQPGGERIVQFCDALDVNGPVPWDPELAEALAEATGLSHGDAAYLFAGLPDAEGIYDVLDLMIVDTLGLTAVTAESARSRFRNLRESDKLALLAAAIPVDPAELWTAGPDVARMANECVSRLGSRTRVPEDILASAERQLPTCHRFIVDIVNPDSCTWLNTNAHRHGKVYPGGGGFESEHWEAATTILQWLDNTLPVNSPIRAALPRAHELVQARLRNPYFNFDFGYVAGNSKKAALLDLLGLQPGTKDHREGWLWLINGGPVRGGLYVYFVPGKYRPEYRETLKAAAALFRRKGHVSPETVLAFYELELDQPA